MPPSPPGPDSHPEAASAGGGPEAPRDGLGRPLVAGHVFEPCPERGPDWLAPTPLATGPWYAGTQHGSPMLGALARAVERHPSDRPRQVVRLTCDLLRAAPLAPVECVAETLRAGKGVEVVEARIQAEGEVFARARALRFRTAEIPAAARATPDEEPPRRDSPESLRRLFAGAREPGGPRREAFHLALEMRPAAGFESPTLWFRLRVPLVAGEETRPLERLAAISDFTYSVPFMRDIARDPGVLAERPFQAINPDTSLNLHRPPQGEWICLDSRLHYSALGAGSALARVFDERGLVGHSSQSILVRG